MSAQLVTFLVIALGVGIIAVVVALQETQIRDLKKSSNANLADLLTVRNELNERLVALETENKPVVAAKETEPALSWQAQRRRAEAGRS